MKKQDCICKKIMNQWMLFLLVIVSVAVFSEENVDAMYQKEAVIGKINVRLNPIFDTSKPEENYWLFKLANRLHIDTDRDVILNDLLFQEGDTFNQQYLDESERILRTRKYLNQVAVTTDPQADGSVDVNIDAHEVWTLFFTASFSRTGGENKSSYGVKDTNFLGYGKSVEVSRNVSDERTTNFFEYFDPNTGWHQTNLAIVHEDSDDGYRHFLALNRPFFSLNTPSAGGFSLEQFKSNKTLYSEGDRVDAFGREQELYSVFYGHKLAMSQSQRVHRMNLGYTHESTDFFILPDELNNFLLPEDREFNIGWFEYQTIPNAFIELVNIRQINRVEDINLGVQAAVKLGYVHSPDELFDGSYYLAAGLFSNTLFSKHHLMSANVNVSGFYVDDQIVNGIAASNIEYFWKNYSRGQFYIRLHGARGLRLFRDQTFGLGAEEGLRGYPNDYTFGENRYLASVEQRFYGQKEWFSLFHVGGAIFYDQGRAWGDTLVEQEFTDDLRNWGVGLRISGTRNGGRDDGANNVLHIDLAQPLDGGNDLDEWQLSVEVRTRF